MLEPGNGCQCYRTSVVLKPLKSGLELMSSLISSLHNRSLPSIDLQQQPDCSMTSSSHSHHQDHGGPRLQVTLQLWMHLLHTHTACNTRQSLSCSRGDCKLLELRRSLGFFWTNSTVLCVRQMCGETCLLTHTGPCSDQYLINIWSISHRMVYLVHRSCS